MTIDEWVKKIWQVPNGVKQDMMHRILTDWRKDQVELRESGLLCFCNPNEIANISACNKCGGIVWSNSNLDKEIKDLRNKVAAQAGVIANITNKIIL